MIDGVSEEHARDARMERSEELAAWVAEARKAAKSMTLNTTWEASRPHYFVRRADTGGDVGIHAFRKPVEELEFPFERLGLLSFITFGNERFAARLSAEELIQHAHAANSLRFFLASFIQLDPSRGLSAGESFMGEHIFALPRGDGPLTGPSKQRDEEGMVIRGIIRQCRESFVAKTALVKERVTAPAKIVRGGQVHWRVLATHSQLDELLALLVDEGILDTKFPEGSDDSEQLYRTNVERLGEFPAFRKYPPSTTFLRRVRDKEWSNRANRFVRPRRSRREVEYAIEEACQGDRGAPLADIAAMVLRSPSTLKSSYLPKLVAEGRLTVDRPGSALARYRSS